MTMIIPKVLIAVSAGSPPANTLAKIKKKMTLIIKVKKKILMNFDMTYPPLELNKVKLLSVGAYYPLSVG